MRWLWMITRSGAATLVLAGLVAGAGRPMARQRPDDTPKRNILFIMSDDHRWDGLRAAGNPHVITPNLDRLAAEGVHFTQATMHVPQCSPARAQLLTGLPPHRTGWYSNQSQRPEARLPDSFDRFPRVPELLRRAGYRTVLVGKWHLPHQPWDIGFSDVRTWLPGGGGPYRNIPLAQGRSREVKPIDGFTQEAFADSAIGFLESDDARTQPFLLWLSFTAPHSPYQPNPPRIARQYEGRRSEDLAPPGFKGEGRTRDWLHYYEAITLLDEQIGRVLQTLQARGLSDRTAVVFSGDNGFMMGSRDWDGKVLPYEGSIRVPLIIRVPGVAKVKGRTDAAASSLDLPPTFARLAGVTPPAEWAGRDLTPVLTGTANHGIDYAVSEFADTTSEQFGRHAYRLARTPSHKLILWHDPARPDELYDLRQDPHEAANLAGHPRAKATETRLRRTLDDWMKKTEDPFRTKR